MSPPKTARSSGFNSSESSKPRYPDYPDRRNNTEYRTGYTSFYPNGRSDSVPPPNSRDSRANSYFSGNTKPTSTTYSSVRGNVSGSRDFSSDHRSKAAGDFKEKPPRPPFNGAKSPRSVAEEKILETCPYELKGLQCPKKQDCNMKRVCLVCSNFL